MGFMVSGTGNAAPWFIDTKHNRVAPSDPEAEIDKISRLNREQAKADAQRAAAHRKDRDRLAQERRLQEHLDDQKRQAAPDMDRRVLALEGRIKQLAAKALENHRDDKTRTELAHAKAQLYWAKNMADLQKPSGK